MRAPDKTSSRLTRMPLSIMSLKRTVVAAMCRRNNAVDPIMRNTNIQAGCSVIYHCKSMPVMKGGSKRRKGASFQMGSMDKGIKESYSD